MNEPDAGQQLKQLAENVIGAADPRPGEIDLAWIGLRVGDKFADRFLAGTVGSTTVTKGVRPTGATGAISDVKLKSRCR